VSWDLATEAMADISKYVLAKYGEHSWAVKMYSYQYFENTYAITKLAMTSVGTPAVAPHDKCVRHQRRHRPGRRRHRLLLGVLRGLGQLPRSPSCRASIPTRPRPRCSPSG
jgi:hypothetical protein